MNEGVVFVLSLVVGLVLVVVLRRTLPVDGPLYWTVVTVSALMAVGSMVILIIWENATPFLGPLVFPALMVALSQTSRSGEAAEMG